MDSLKIKKCPAGYNDCYLCGKCSIAKKELSIQNLKIKKTKHKK